MMSAHRSRKGIPSEAAYCVPVEAKPRLVHKNMAQLRQYQASVVYCIFVMYESSVMSCCVMHTFWLRVFYRHCDVTNSCVYSRVVLYDY